MFLIYQNLIKIILMKNFSFFEEIDLCKNVKKNNGKIYIIKISLLIMRVLAQFKKIII